MPKPRPPVKTPLGLDELRTRTHGLNQRHRTMLFLVDGQRPLSEVLALALQAGARTSHFEDLVHLGLVEVAIDADVDVEEPTPSQRAALDSGGISTQSGVLAVDLARPPVASVPPAAARRASRRQPVSGAETAAKRPARPSKPPPAGAESRTDARTAVAPASDIDQHRALADTEADEQALNQEVRGLLIDTLRLDAPLFAALTLVRVRRAQTAKELINLVWEIERHLVTSSKSHPEMESLYRARELLGMGNTQVSTDTPTGFPDTE